MLLTGCIDSSTPAGPDQHESRSVDLEKAERVRARLKIAVGELNVKGGAQKLADADFTYNVPEWKPDVQYRITGSSGDLTIEQRGSTSTSGNKKNRWDIRLADSVPLDLGIELGAGETRLDLGSLNLEGLDVRMGAGTLRMDLRGSPKKDYSAKVQGGVGEATIYLPKNVGIAATAAGGIGDISVEGLQKKGDRWVNDAFEGTGPKIRLDVRGGVGTVKLIAQ